MQGKVNEQFISNYSKEFSSKVVSSFFKDKAVIQGKEILSLTPSKQVNHFVLKALYAQWQEEMKKLESPYFNYRDTEVKKALANYMNVLSQHIEVKQPEMTDLVEVAMVEALHWLLLPVESLEGELSHKNINVVDGEGLKAITRYYKILSADLHDVMEKNAGEEISTLIEAWKERVEELDHIETIKSELLTFSKIAEITIEDVFEEFNVPPESDEVQEIQEENFFEKEERIDDEMEEKEETENENDFIREGEPSSLEEVYDQNEEEQDYEQVMGGDSDGENEDIKKEVDLEGVLTEEDTDEGDDSDQMDGSVNEKFRKEEETLNDQFRHEEVSVATTHQKKKVESILEAISVNNQYMFTSELFNGDKETFIESIGKIEKSSSFDDAVEMLVEEYSVNYSWDMNSNEVKELLKVVFRRFR